MIEAARSFRLAEEPRSRFGEFGFAELAGERNGLDCDQPIDRGIAAQIDDTHGAAADFALELIAAQPLHISPLPRAGASPAGDAEPPAPMGATGGAAAARGVRLGGRADRRPSRRSRLSVWRARRPSAGAIAGATSR